MDPKYRPPRPTAAGMRYLPRPVFPALWGFCFYYYYWYACPCYYCTGYPGGGWAYC